MQLLLRMEFNIEEWRWIQCWNVLSQKCGLTGGKSPLGSEPMVWVGDFNAHNELWGSKKRNRNGKIVEEFIDKNS